MKKSIIKLLEVWKTYRMGEIELHALQGISLDIARGEFIAITGPSGSGKSTIMNIVGCLDLPSSGLVELDEHDISKLNESSLSQIRGKTIGFVFQQFNLIPTLSALENVMLPMEFQNIPSAKARETATKMLLAVGLSDRLNHLPSQLSGGERQRVAIARALSNEPEVILADEPTGNLDSKSGEAVLYLLMSLWKEKHKTLIIVTHDVNLASHAKRRVELKDGKIIK